MSPDHRQAEIASRPPELLAGEAHKRFAWGPDGFLASAVFERTPADVRLYGGARLIEIRRYFGPTAPYERRGRGFAWQLARLVAANVWVAPGAHLWIAARRAS